MNNQYWYNFFLSDQFSWRILVTGILILFVVILLIAWKISRGRLEKIMAEKDDTRFRILIESLEDILIFFDSQFVSTDVWIGNEKIKTHFAEKKIGMDFRSFFQGIIADEAIKNVFSAMRRGQPFFSLELQPIGVQNAWIRFSIKKSGIIGYACVIEDISEWKNNILNEESHIHELDDSKKAMLNVLEDVTEEKKMIESLAAQLDLATKSAKIGVWEWDVIKNEIIWNDQMYRLYGVNKTDFIVTYEAWQNRVHTDDRQKREEALKAEKDFDLTSRVLWPDGQIHFMKAFGKVEKDASGKALKMVGVNWDVTKQEEVDRMKTEFVSFASHQLKTPITRIKLATTELLGSDALTEKEKSYYLKAIQDSNNEMHDLVNFFLDMRKIESGQLAIDKKEIRLKPFLVDLVEELQDRVNEKKQKFVQITNLANDMVVSDSKYLKEIYKNILTNAIKYTPEHGTVTLEVQKKGSVLLSRISDTGMGIPASEQAQVFEKYYRASNAQKQIQDGNGLGLYFVKEVVEKLGGKIWFESVEGKGTDFYFNVPV